jgi:tetratricopeptide (TPR) repeat protein
MKVKSAYGLLGDALRRRLDLRAGQDPEEQRTRIQERIGAALPASDARRVAVFLGELCGVHFPDEESPQLRAARQDPRIMSDQVERAWLDALRLMRTDEPLLLILEDVHWSDALTVKLVGAALRQLRDNAFMVLALARPEVHELYPNLWAESVQLVRLHPLPRKAGERLVKQVLGPEVPPDQIGQLVEQSAGNPLFLEELIRATAERKTGELPETVTAMIQARIGRLAAGARRVLRAASVFGENFWEKGVFQLLAATHGDEQAPGTLEDLVREEIIEKVLEGRFVNEPQYRFRHALFLEAVSGLVGEHEARAWHGAAGSYLESVGEREPAVLAEHFRLGELYERAIPYYLRAAAQAYEAVNAEAVFTFVKRGIAAGAKNADHGNLLSLQIATIWWREQFQEVLALGPQALALLPKGGLPWCRIFEALFPVAVVMQQNTLLSELLGQFLAVEPNPEARTSYIRAAGTLGLFCSHAGQKGPARLLLDRVQQVSTFLSSSDLDGWAFTRGPEAIYTDDVLSRPHLFLTLELEANRLFKEAGNLRVQAITGAYRGKALSDLGRRDEAIAVLRENLELAECLQDGLPLNYNRLFLAEILASGTDTLEHKEAEKLAGEVFGTQNILFLGLAHAVMARVILNRGDILAAEQEAQEACELLRPFLPYRLHTVALLSRILTTQEKGAAALKNCEEAAQELDALGLESQGMLALLVALAEAQQRNGLNSEARGAIVRALVVLRERVADIPDASMRKIYSRQVPEIARLLHLAREWGIDGAGLHLDS